MKAGRCLVYAGLFFAASLLLSGCWVSFRQVAPPEVIKDMRGRVVSVVQPLGKPIPPLKLRSGYSVRILSRTYSTTQDGSLPPAVRIDYLSNLPVRSSPALQQEVNEIKDGYKKEIDGTGLQALIITAEEPVSKRPDGSRLTYTFVWKRDKKGGWHQLNK